MSNNSTRGSIWGRNGMIASFALLLALVATPVLAIPQDFDLKAYPDVFSDYITFSYDQSTRVFEGQGFLQNYKYDAATYDIPVVLSSPAGYSFDIGGTLDSNFNLTTGFLSINGIGDNSDTYSLYGTLTAMWHGTGDSPLKFQFDPTEGTLLNDFSTGKGGVIIGSFDFSNLTDGFSQNSLTADVGVIAAPVPEPGTVSLFLLGCTGLAALRRRQTKSKSA